MVDLRAPAERRYDLAADRDDAAERRDAASDNRDDTAHRRDIDAEERDNAARQDSDRLDDRLRTVRRQLLDGLARCADTIDPDDQPATARGARRLLADPDLTAVITLVDDLDTEIQRIRNNRRTAAGERRAAARDRYDAACDRKDSALDRALSARDRSQAAIERVQAELGDLPSGRQLSSTHESLIDRGANATAVSRQRIADSREQLARLRDRTGPPAPTPHDGASGSSGG
jgi:hypothetical protein